MNLRQLLGKYAIELVVIFTGITLSFAFEEWRKERTDRAEERRVLLSLHRDLARKLNELISDSASLTQLTGMADSLRSAEKQRMASDVQYMNWVSYTWGTNFSFNPTTAAYKVVTQTGKLDLLSNDSLRSSIVELHEYTFPGLAKSYLRHESFDDERLQPMARSIPWNRMNEPLAFRKEVNVLLSGVNSRDILYWKSYMCRRHSELIGHSLSELRQTLRKISAKLVST